MNCTGTYTFIITDFNRKLSEAKDRNDDGAIYGDPFYSSLFGYKMRMIVQLYETRERYKGHMGVDIALMKSDHDAILSWPFNKSYTFTLIDQQDNEEERNNIEWSVTPEGEKDFERPKDFANLACGYGMFVSHTTLETRKYIKDDTVFITVSVKP